MKNLVLFFISFWFIIVFTACPGSTEDFNIDFGYDYYPMEEGSFWHYKVDSILIKNEGHIRDTSSSYLREYVEEEFIDQLEDTTYRLERYFNSELNDNWLVKDVWTSYNDEIKVVRTEENLKYLKMTFPLEVGKKWDGNTFLDESLMVNIGGEILELFLDWEYKILNIAEFDTIGGNVYSDVVTIQNADNVDPNLEFDETDKLHRRLVIEKYAKGVGLIYKKHLIIDSQCTTSDCEFTPWEEKAIKGYSMEMVLVEYGK